MKCCYWCRKHIRWLEAKKRQLEKQIEELEAQIEGIPEGVYWSDKGRTLLGGFMNKEIAEKTLQYVIDNPEKHKQTVVIARGVTDSDGNLDWSCEVPMGTNPMTDCGTVGCIAGWACVVGGTMELLPVFGSPDWIMSANSDLAFQALEIEPGSEEGRRFFDEVFSILNRDVAILNFKELISEYGK